MAKNSLPNNLSIDNLEFVRQQNHRQFVDRAGQKFFRLTVLGYAGRSYWFCQCECGTIKKVLAPKLTRTYGATKSCGCWDKEAAAARMRTHGQVGTPTYRSWKNMRMRCQNPSNPAYKNYGGRGINICDRWNDFSLFLQDMGPRPRGKYSIERQDNNGNYCPENCKWATVDEQAKNRRSTIWLTYQNRTQRVSEWGEELGMRDCVIHDRLKRGWSAERTLTQPVIRRGTNPACSR